MKIADLGPYGYPRRLLNIWEQERSTKLLPLQEKAIQDYHLLDENPGNLLIIAPTSSGKTFLGELVAVREARRLKRTMFLVPFRAIAEELYANFTRKYREYGIPIAISDRDHSEHDDDILDGTYRIAIIVYEKLSNLLIIKPELFAGCDLVIADEVQMMMDSSRGPTVELLLTKLLLSPSPVRIIALSAVLEKLNGFNQWLKAEVLIDHHRPVELREAIYTRDGKAPYHEFNGNQTGVEDLGPWNAPKDGLLRLCQSMVERDEQVLIFCSTRNSAVETAKFVAEGLSDTPGVRPATSAIRAANDLVDSTTREELQALLRSAVAYHNSDLLLEERLLVEDWFRKKEIKALTCTSTLAMGINVPARNVVIYEPWKWDGDQEKPISVAEYKNMSGRAGRYSAGDEYGRAYLIAKSHADADAFEEMYLLGSVEGFSSSFGRYRIDSQVLEIIAGGLARTPKEVNHFVFSTYNGQHLWTSEQSREEIGQRVLDAVARCLDYKAVERDDTGVLTATPLGRMCAAGGYTLDHLAHAVEYVKTYKTDVVPSVIYWALDTDMECNSQAYHVPKLRTPEYKSGLYQSKLAELANTEALGDPLDGFAEYPESITYDECVTLRRCLACYAWISDLPFRRIEENFRGIKGGALKNTAEVCAWLISLLEELIKTMDPRSERHLGLKMLVERLPYGATEEALELCRIKDSGLAREERNHLVNKGICTLDDILSRAPGEIPLTQPKALTLKKAAEATIEDNMEKRKRSQSTRLSALGMDTILLAKLYEKEGTELELVIDDVLKPPFITLTCQRVTRQNDGDPDHLLHDLEGKVYAIQTTAREKKNVAMTKAASVIGQSAKYKPDGYIVIGRPDFHRLAIDNAADQKAAGLNYKLLPVSTLAEMLVLFHEKKFTAQDVENILLEWQGHITIGRITDFLST